ncbi:hypothetical protein KC093_06985 [Acinetobacter nosocomialis]|uniref:tetratricopeptide repeat protein n=1 Tax=Acinetobacter nosocomialis TaxID=106654 RepID=UPI001B834F0F|nr:CFI-box-CTERM domain-containing protein [Acinetobacter nosocomialis]MBR7749906.1 hypothetical protein [Acinetobacter nosocomialis]
MEQKVLGYLFGIELHSPIIRSEIRSLIKAKNEYVQNKATKDNLTIQQALLDAGDLVDEFVGSLTDEDGEKFVDLYTEELIASQDVNADLNKIGKTSEAESYHLQAQFIFNELSANLKVYGSNSALTGANPANVGLALEYIDRSLEIEPENPIYLNLKGLLIWNGLGDKGLAKPFIEKAAKLDPRNITIQHNLKAVQDPNGCFIATATFGTPLAYEVNELRYWRDTTLTKHLLGKLIVQFYYKVSPPIATIIKNSQRLKSLIRLLLKPVVKYVSKVNKSKTSN